jgi:hypothetical protein
VQGGITKRLGSQRRVIPSLIETTYEVRCLRLNYKVSFCMSINSLRKKKYKIVYSLCSLQSIEAHLGREPIVVLPQEREEIYISRMVPRVERVEVVND